MQVIENYIKVYLDLNSNIEIHKYAGYRELHQSIFGFKF